MSKNGQLGQIVAPLSTPVIYEVARMFRVQLGLGDVARICPVRILEGAQLVGLVELEIVEDEEFEPRTEAITYPDLKWMKVRRSVYDGAYAGNRRYRFTLAHEIGHLILHKDMAGYARLEPGIKRFFHDPEYQANAFAAALLMDERHMHKEMSEEEVMSLFEVSKSAAKARLAALRGS